jgi:hypothetical protein
MDLKHGDDIYDSFRAYQNKLLRDTSMADEFHFRVLDARRSSIAFRTVEASGRGISNRRKSPPNRLRAQRRVGLGAGGAGR